MADVPCPGKGWKPNKGEQPRGTKGKRIRAVLRHGREATYDNNPMSPPGWAADGKGGCTWEFRNFPFDIVWYLTL